MDIAPLCFKVSIYTMRKWIFSGKKMLNCDISSFSNFHFFNFSDLSASFSANFQLLGMELVSNVYLWSIPPSPGNNSFSTKWALYLWNATYTTYKIFSGSYPVVSIFQNIKLLTEEINNLTTNLDIIHILGRRLQCNFLLFFFFLDANRVHSRALEIAP